MKKFFIFVLTALISLGSFAVIADKKVSPVDIAGAKTITAKEARVLFDKGVLFIDVRKDKDWAAGRIPDAIHLELKKVLTEESLVKEVKKDQDVVFYCNGPKCMRSSKATTKAVAWGFKQVYYLREGLPGWKAEGFPVE